MDILDKINNSLNGINGFFSKIGAFLDNPGGELMKFLGQFFKECLETLSLVSFEWLLLIGMIGLLFAIFGSERGKKIAIFSPVIYVLLQVLAGVLC